MNGNPFTANYIGSTGEYPIYDLIKSTSNYINYTSNVLQYNSSNFVKIKVDALSNSVYTEINSIKATDTSQSSQISTLEATAVANTDAIVVQAGLIQALQDLEVVQTGVLIAHTTAIATINNGKMDKISFEGTSVIYRDLVGNVQLGWDDVTFKTVPLAFANRRLLTFSDTYYNLPTTKQDKIIWSSPLSYNIDTKTASVDLNSYLTSNILSNVNINYGFVHSNILGNLVSPFVSSNVLSNVNINYGFLHSNALSNLVYPFISSNVLSNININKGFLHSNALSNLLYPLISSNVLSNININNGFLHSNALSNLVYPLASSNVLSNINLNDGFLHSNVINSLFNPYVSSNFLSNININRGFLHSNVITNLFNPYVSSNFLSNININQGFLHSNVITNLFYPYVSSNVLTNVVEKYLPLLGGTLKGNTTIGEIGNNKNLTIIGNLTVDNNNTSSELYVRGNCFATEMVKTTTLYLGNGQNLFTGEYGAKIMAPFNGSNGNNIDFMSRSTTNGAFQTNLTITSSGNVGIGYQYPQYTLDVNGTVNTTDLKLNGLALSNSFLPLSGGIITGKLGIGTNIPPIPNTSLIVGDGGRLKILGDNASPISRWTQIGTRDESDATNNTMIRLYDTYKYISYYGTGTSNANNEISSGHSFIGDVQMNRLRVGGLATLFKNEEEFGDLFKVGNNFKVDWYGKVFCSSISSTNIVSKTPFIINASTSVSINNVGGLYKYDLDLRQYAGTFQTAEGYLMRYFKISTFYSSPAKFYNSVYANSYCFSQNIMITNAGGLTFFSPYTLGSWYGEFIGNDNYWMRNSFDYITFIHGHITDISNSNKKWYVIIEDLLS